MPGFPSDVDDPSHVFLANEAAQLGSHERVDLTVCGEVESRSTQRYQFLRIRPPSGLVAKARFIVWLVKRRRKLLLGLLKNRGEVYPLAWRHWEIDRLLSDLQPDLVHSHFVYPSGTAAVDLARERSIPVVASVRGVDISVEHELGYGLRLDPSYNSRLRLSLGQIDLVLAATEPMRVAAIEAGASPARTQVLPNAVDSEKFAPLSADERLEEREKIGIPASATVAIGIGNLIPRKGFDLGVRALALEPSMHLVLVGDGPERLALAELAQSLGVESRLHLIGKVSHDEIRLLLGAADVYWFLSRSEAFGNVVVEALAAGLPIVGTEVGVAVTILPQLANCELIPREAEALLAATARHLGERLEPSQLKDVLKTFDPVERVALLLRAYESVL